MDWQVLFIVIGIVAVILFVLIGIASIWKKVPQDKALVVTGLHKRVITGGGGCVVPLFERVDMISLENMKIEVKTEGALTEQGVEIYVDGIAVVKVKSDIESILMAMEQFNTGREQQTIDNIMSTVRDVLEGKLREIISKLTVEEIYKDREKFASEVEAVASVGLADMGLEIKVFTIRDINDRNQYLESLGKRQIAQVKKEAAIAEADANRETAERTAEAARLSQEAKLAAETKVAMAAKDKAVKLEEYRREQEVARATAENAYAIQENIVKQEVTETAMRVEILQKEKQTELAEKESARRERELDATVRRQADAELYRREQEAKAEKVRQVREAESSAETIRLEGQARAEAIRLSGQAEADALRMKGLAEAEVIKQRGLAEAEAMARKAEAFRQYDEAAVLQMIIDKLPEIAANVAAPLAKTEKIVMIGDGGASKMTKDITGMIAQVPEIAESLTGINIADLVKQFVSKSANAGAAASQPEEQREPQDIVQG